MPIDPRIRLVKCLFKQKARDSVLVTRPAFRGSRIALFVRTSNAEAHAEYDY